MKILNQNNYRKILKTLVEQRKKIDRRYSFQSLSEAIRVPKSYVSKVVLEQAHFNADQLFAACQFLELPDAETVYLTLLLEHERSVNRERRRRLDAQIKAIQKKNVDTREYIEARHVADDKRFSAEYFADPLHMIIHVSLHIPRYAANLGTLARDLGIPPAAVHRTVASLGRLGIIEHSGSKIKVLIDQIHLPKSAEVFKAWNFQMNAYGLSRINCLEKDDYCSLNVVFCATESVRKELHQEFLEYLNRAEKLVVKAPTENTYQLSFNLFGWTNS